MVIVQWVEVVVRPFQEAIEEAVECLVQGDEHEPHLRLLLERDSGEERLDDRVINQVLVGRGIPPFASCSEQGRFEGIQYPPRLAIHHLLHSPLDIGVPAGKLLQVPARLAGGGDIHLPGIIGIVGADIQLEGALGEKRVEGGTMVPQGELHRFQIARYNNEGATIKLCGHLLDELLAVGDIKRFGIGGRGGEYRFSSASGLTETSSTNHEFQPLFMGLKDAPVVLSVT